MASTGTVGTASISGSAIKYEYDDRVGQWIDPKTGEVRPESYSQDEISEDNSGVSEQVSDDVVDNDIAEIGDSEVENAEDQPQKPAFTLSKEQIGQGMRWTKDEETGEPLPCPNCGRGLVEVTRERQLFHVCYSLLESEYPSCDYFKKVVKESTKPEYAKTGTGKKAKTVKVVALPATDEE